MHGNRLAIPSLEEHQKKIEREEKKIFDSDGDGEATSEGLDG